jgi:nucleotide-binding universal stress UspA family protein
MIENIKGVLVCLTKEFGPDEISSALGYGLSLAQQAGAHETVLAASVKIQLTGVWVTRFASGLVHAENQRLHALAEAVAMAAQADAGAAGVICFAYTPHLSYAALLASFTAQAGVHDLTVIDAEPEPISLDRGVIEKLLTQSGRPLIIVPQGLETFRGRRIIVAWDGSAKAARAAGDALPFLRAAEAVDVIAVTGEKDLPDIVPGSDIAAHLARHGISVTVSCLAARDGDVGATLTSAADSFGADMIVMGGFVHWRMREMVFGGVTQSLLRKSPVPLFMSY